MSISRADLSIHEVKKIEVDEILELDKVYVRKIRIINDDGGKDLVVEFNLFSYDKDSLEIS